jgi:hypothetical protein
LTELLASDLVSDQLPPFELIMYAPWPSTLKLKEKFLAWTTFLWHTPTASQFIVPYFMRKASFLLCWDLFR